MLKNYLGACYKNFIRQKLVSIISLFGLAIALCVFILISLYVRKEYSYDTHWRDFELIFRLTSETTTNMSSAPRLSTTPYPVASLLRQYYSDAIELAARRLERGQSITIGDNVYPDSSVSLVEREFIDIFSFEEVAGDLRGTLQVPGNIALSEASAKEYFGRESALGRILTLSVAGLGEVDYQISAVYRLPDGNSTMDLPNMALLETTALPEHAATIGDWGGDARTVNYFKIKRGVDINKLNLGLPAFVDEYVQPLASLGDDGNLSNILHYQFQNIADIHFAPASGEPVGDETQVKVFALIASLVLLIGGSNFVVLATAKGEERKGEVGIRKVLGATRGQLMVQFVGEALVFSVAAAIIAVALLELAVPLFASLIAQNLAVDYLDPRNILFLVMLVIGVGLLAGFYPAFVLTNLKPGRTLMGSGTSRLVGPISVRSLLVGFQFTIAIILVVVTLAVYLQLSFYKNRSLGFNPENLYAVRLTLQGANEGMEPLINEIQNRPGVTGVALSSRQPNSRAGTSNGNTYTRENQSETSVKTVGLFVGYDFFELYEIPLLAGRSYDPDLDIIDAVDNQRFAESSSFRYTLNNRVIINKAAADALGFPSPEAAVGQQIRRANGQLVEIIGVTGNTKFLSLQEETGPEDYTFNLRSSRYLTIRFHPSVSNTIRQEISSVWDMIETDMPVNGNFVMDNMQVDITQEKNLGSLLITFSLLAVVISSMGLYGLAAFTVIRRVKEIGIRKVMGADSYIITRLFIWQFSKPVLLANIFAWPLALWAIMTWLQRFPDQVDRALIYPLFPVAGLMALAIACLTVGSTTAAAARSNPVKSLRCE